MRRATIQGATALLVVAVALVGCLFPSFDNLESSESSTKPKKDAGTVVPPAASSVPPAPPVDPGWDSGLPRVPSTVTDCFGVVCNTDADSFCCVNLFSDPQCMNGTNADCAALAGGRGRAVRCDGPEDCPSGSVCCFVNDAVHGGDCMKECDSASPTETKQICREDKDCPTGHPCGTQKFFGMFNYCKP